MEAVVHKLMAAWVRIAGLRLDLSTISYDEYLVHSDLENKT